MKTRMLVTCFLLAMVFLAIPRHAWGGDYPGDDLPSISANAKGDFVVCWLDENCNIYAQRYDSSGHQIGEKIKVSDDNPKVESRRFLVAAANNAGSFVVCWQERKKGRKERWGIYAQLYSFGNRQGDNFLASLSGESLGLSAAMDAAGNFVICWDKFSDGNVYAQRYDNKGNSRGAAFRVNNDEADPNTFAYYPAVAMNDAGRFVVCWNTKKDRRFPALKVVYVQIYDANGTAQRDNILVAEAESDDIIRPIKGPPIAMDASGNFVICWDEDENEDEEAAIYARQYDSSGNPRSSILWAGKQYGGSSHLIMGLEPQGNFVVFWLTSSRSFRWRQFKPDGTPQGEMWVWYLRKGLAWDPIGIVAVTEKIITPLWRSSGVWVMIKEWEEGPITKPSITISYQQKSAIEDVVRLIISGLVLGGKYQVYYCDDLSCQDNWLKFGEPIGSPGWDRGVTDDGELSSPSPSEVKSRFYRVERLP